MRINLTKKDLVNLVYMQLGFSKQISENLIEDFLSTIVSNIKQEKKLKLSKFGTFSIREKKSRIGRNPKTKEEKNISERNVVLFKPSNEFKDFINFKDNLLAGIDYYLSIVDTKFDFSKHDLLKLKETLTMRNQEFSEILLN